MPIASQKPDTYRRCVVGIHLTSRSTAGTKPDTYAICQKPDTVAGFSMHNQRYHA